VGASVRRLGVWPRAGARLGGWPNWKQVGRNLRFSSITQSARAAAAAHTRGEATEGGEPHWAVKEAQLLYELAVYLHSEVGEMRQELERNSEAAQAATAFARAIKAGLVDERVLITMAAQRDGELLQILDGHEPGTSTRVLALTPHHQRRVWWVLNSVEFTRPSAPPEPAPRTLNF